MICVIWPEVPSPWPACPFNPPHDHVFFLADPCLPAHRSFIGPFFMRIDERNVRVLPPISSRPATTVGASRTAHDLLSEKIRDSRRNASERKIMPRKAIGAMAMTDAERQARYRAARAARAPVSASRTASLSSRLKWALTSSHRCRPQSFTAAAPSRLQGCNGLASRRARI